MDAAFVHGVEWADNEVREIRLGDNLGWVVSHEHFAAHFRSVALDSIKGIVLNPSPYIDRAVTVPRVSEVSNAQLDATAQFLCWAAYPRRSRVNADIRESYLFGCGSCWEELRRQSSVHVVRWRLATIFPDDRPFPGVQYIGSGLCSSPWNLPTVNGDIRSQFPSGDVLCNADSLARNSIGPPSFGKVPHQEDRSSKSKNRTSPRWDYLFFDGIGGPYLGIQVFCIMFVGFGFAVLSVFGIRRALDDPDRKRRAFGWLLFGVGCVGGLTCYGWGYLGHPLRIWGLA